MALIPAAQLGASRFVSYDAEAGVVAAETPDGSIANLLVADPATGNAAHLTLGAGGAHLFEDAAGNPIATLSPASVAAHGEVLAKGTLNVRDWENLFNRPDAFPPGPHTHAFAELTGRPTTLAGYGITDALAAAHTHDLAGTSLTGVLPLAKGGTGLSAAGAAGTVLLSTGGAAAFGQVTDAGVAPGAAIAWSKVSKTGAAAADVGALSQAAADARYFQLTGGLLTESVVVQSTGQGDILRLVGMTPWYGANVRFENDGQEWRIGINRVFDTTGVFHLADSKAGKVAMVVASNGYVSINPTGPTPAEALDVNGNVKVRGAVVYADGTTQASAAYTKAQADTRYVHAGTQWDAGQISGVLPVAHGGTGLSAAGAAGTVLLSTGTAAAFGQVGDAGIAPDAAIAPSKVDFAQPVASMYVNALTARVLQVEGQFLPHLGVNLSNLVMGPPLVEIPAGAPVCVNLDADRVDGWEAAELRDLGSATGLLAWSQVDRAGAVLADLGGELPVGALPTTGGSWFVGTLRMEGNLSVGNLDADGLTLQGGRPFNTSDDIASLSRANEWADANVFAPVDDLLPAAAFRRPEDAAYRLQVDRRGALEWGGGAGPADAALYRPAAATLALHGRLMVGAPVPVVGTSPGSTLALTDHALEVAGDVKVRGSVLFADGGAQAGAAYTTAESDARYAPQGGEATFMSATVIGDLQADTVTATYVTVTNEVGAGSIVLHTPTGQPPIMVPAGAQTCPNLDADRLDGHEAEYFTGYADALRDEVSAGMVDIPFQAINTSTTGMAPGALILKHPAGDNLASLAPGATGTVLLAAPGSPVWGHLTDGNLAEFAAISPAKIDFSQTVAEMTVQGLTVGVLEVAGQLMPSIVGINFSSLGQQRAPFVNIPDDSLTCHGLDADKLDGHHGDHYLLLSNATGTLPADGLAGAYAGVTGLGSLTGLDVEGNVSVLGNAVIDTVEIQTDLNCQAAYFHDTIGAYAPSYHPPIRALPNSMTCENLDADRLDGRHGAEYLDLANATGSLPGVAALPTAGGSWLVDTLSLPNTVWIGQLGVGSLAVGGGRVVHSSDELARLDDYNVFENTNLFEQSDYSASVLATRKLGDASFRLAVNYAGSMEWGAGSAAADAGLYRSGAGALAAWGRLHVGAPQAYASGSAIHAAAALQVDSTTRGFLPPRMTTAQRDAIASPPDGLIVYNSTTGKLNLREAGAWKALASA